MSKPRDDVRISNNGPSVWRRRHVARKLENRDECVRSERIARLVRSMFAAARLRGRGGR